VFLAVASLALPPDSVAAAVAIAEVERPFDCKSSSDIFVECFICGRLANDKRIYDGCCAGDELINEYCKLMLA